MGDLVYIHENQGMTTIFMFFFKQAVKIKILPMWLSFGSSLQWAK